MMLLSPDLLLSAYCQGVFPMAHEDGQIYWYDPDPRAIIPLDAFYVSRSLQRTIRQKQFEIRINSRFAAVIRGCAQPAPGREDTWINADIIRAYEEMYKLGFAHSVECWQGEKLVGGLYGIAVNGFFAGESMFSRKRDASKVALVALVTHLKQRRFQLLDIQFMTEHLRGFGAIELPQEAYKARLARALQIPAQFAEMSQPEGGYFDGKEDEA